MFLNSLRSAQSFCQMHSCYTRFLPHRGYSQNVKERVCTSCEKTLSTFEERERILWRDCRARDYLEVNSSIMPYFNRGVDSIDAIMIRIAKGALAAARQIPLGASAYMVVETAEILRRHGLTGIYSLVLRKEFVAAAELLRKVTGIERAWPLSVHDLTAAIFYALASKRLEVSE